MTAIDMMGVDFNASNLDTYDMLVTNYRADNPGPVQSIIAGTTTPILSLAGYASQSARLGIHGGTASFQSITLDGAESTVVDASHPLFTGITTSNGAAIDILAGTGNANFGAMDNALAIGDVLFTNSAGAYTGAAFLPVGTTLGDGVSVTNAPILFLDLPDFAGAQGIDAKLTADGFQIVDNFRNGVIPEPSTFALLAVTAGILMAYRRRK